MNTSPSLQQQIEASPALLPTELADHLNRSHKEGLGGFIPGGLTELPAGVRKILDRLFTEEGSAIMDTTLQMVPKDLREPTPIAPGRRSHAFVPMRSTGLRVTGPDQSPIEIEVKAGTLVGPRAALGLAPTASVQFTERNVPYARFTVPSEMGTSPEDQLRWLLAHGWVMAALQDNLVRANSALEGKAPAIPSSTTIRYPHGITSQNATLPPRQDVALDPGSFLQAQEAGLVGVRATPEADLSASFGIKPGDLIGEGSAFGFKPMGHVISKDPLHVMAFHCEGLSLEDKARLAGPVARSFAEKYRIAEQRAGK